MARRKMGKKTTRRIPKKKHLRKVRTSSGSAPNLSFSMVSGFTKSKIAAVSASALLLGLIGVSIIGMFLFAFFSKDLPSPDTLTNRDQALSTTIMDRNGKSLFDIYGDQNRVLVTLEEIPPELIQATLAVEDAEFYRHKGFDIPGIIRSFFKIVLRGNVQGGSTITQQVVKNTLLSSEQTITRKIKELVLSLQIEKRFTKNEILQMYFNEAPYGGQAWGVEAAANSFFNKSASELTPSEAVFLAGLPQSPSAFLADPEAAEFRRQTVIRLMEEKGWYEEDGTHRRITASEAEKLRTDAPKVSAVRQSIQAPHFVWYVRQILEERYGTEMVEQGGLRVTTTLDKDLHSEFQDILTEEVDKAASLLLSNGALVAIDPRTGEILSMVGSKDYFDEDNDGNVNVTTSLRQPGSSLKPITYVAAFKQGYTAATMVVDALTGFPGGAGNPEYKPKNYDGTYRGPVQLRYALANSMNVPAVKVLSLAGIDTMLRTAYDMGLSTLEPTQANKTRFGLSVTLGGGEVSLLELTSAYSVFANKGVRQEPVAILKVEDRSGKVLEEHKPVKGRAVLTEEESYLISHILSDNSARALVFGTGSQLNIPGHQVAVKTGTTDDIRDNWAVGYTPNIAIGVWVGNNDNSPMHPNLSSGLTGATPIWNRAMTTFLSEYPAGDFERPSGIITADVDALSGKLPGDHTEETRNEIFIQGTVPVEVDDMHIELEICEEDDDLANDDCRDDDKVDEKVFIVLKALREEWQEAVDEWIEEEHEDDDEWNPPDDESDYESEDDDEDSSFLEDFFGSIAEPAVTITTPSDNQKVGNTFAVEADVKSPYTVLKVEFYLNDSLVASDTSIPYSATMKPSSDSDQRITVKAYDSSGAVGSSEVDISI